MISLSFQFPLTLLEDFKFENRLSFWHEILLCCKHFCFSIKHVTLKSACVEFGGKLVLEEFRLKHGFSSNHCRFPRPYQRHRSSWKCTGNIDSRLGKKISLHAVHSPRQPRSVRHVVFNPRQLIPHRKHRAGKMVVRPNNVQSQCTVLAIFLL